MDFNPWLANQRPMNGLVWPTQPLTHLLSDGHNLKRLVPIYHQENACHDP